jgi:subtilisin family serine protease
MRTIIAVLAVICLANAVYTGYRPKSEIIPGRYIFQFNKDASVESKDAFLASFAQIAGNKVRQTFQFHDFHAFSAETTEDFAASAKVGGLFKTVESDMTVHVQQQQCHVQSGATWGIDRISERAITLDGEYSYEYDGAPTDSYIIDTGILLTHNEFAAGRAIWGSTHTGDNNHNDCHGHGTHVAGTVGGTLYGVAKKVSVIAVKVLNCGGSGSWEGVMGGINWCVTEYNRKNKKPSTGNMSLGGGYHQGINDATDAAVRAGIVMAVAGGNSNADACNYSPASAELAITVGSTDVGSSGGVQRDIRSSFSNFGQCTDMWAPGSMITSAWIGSNTAVRTISGTSMASPHVCGVANLILHEHPSWSAKQVEDHMIEESTKGIIDLACGNRAACLQSPNRMVFSACDI